MYSCPDFSELLCGGPPQIVHSTEAEIEADFALSTRGEGTFGLGLGGQTSVRGHERRPLR